MDRELAQRLRDLVGSREVAALGTLHGGEPYVSMVPYALMPEGAGFIVHVSALAAHTKDMLSSPAVSLMIMAAPGPEVPPQALARVTIQGDAMRIPPEAPIHAIARRIYLERFPQSAPTFDLGDFALFAIRPRQARYVGGFAQAKTLTAESLAEALR
jgi:putative heme iron utilization protein